MPAGDAFMKNHTYFGRFTILSSLMRSRKFISNPGAINRFLVQKLTIVRVTGIGVHDAQTVRA